MDLHLFHNQHRLAARAANLSIHMQVVQFPFRHVILHIAILFLLSMLRISHADDLSSQEIPETPGLRQIDLTQQQDDLWERIRRGFGMQNLDDSLVRDQQAWYLSHPQYLQRMVERAQKYMYFVVDELEKRGMPTELALLPMVESAYNPTALSPAQAAGMWQFIPGTGKLYGLEQNWWKDERRDVVASTQAALDYLQRIYEMHGDWHLALASYNWGEGAVGRAIARNQAAGLPTDYSSLNMPNETRNYVPKLQALKNIISRPDLYRITLQQIPNKPYFTTLRRDKDIDLALAARLAGMPLSEFVSLNPQFKRPVIRGGSDVKLVIPAERADQFKDQVSNSSRPLVNWQTYTLRPREKLEKVAERFGTTGLKLRQANGLHPRANVGGGTLLLVPVSPEAVEGLDVLANLNPPAAPPTPVHNYTARARNTKGKAAKAKPTKGSASNTKRAPSKKPSASKAPPARKRR